MLAGCRPHGILSKMLDGRTGKKSIWKRGQRTHWTWFTACSTWSPAGRTLHTRSIVLGALLTNSFHKTLIYISYWFCKITMSLVNRAGCTSSRPIPFIFVITKIRNTWRPFFSVSLPVQGHLNVSISEDEPIKNLRSVKGEFSWHIHQPPLSDKMIV